jgi:hypothetical protein
VGTPLTFELKKAGRYTARGEVGRRPEAGKIGGWKAQNLFDRINRIDRIGFLVTT